MPRRPRARATPPSPCDPDTAELVRAKCAASGLTEADAATSGLTGLSAAATAALHPSFQAVRSLLIPYYDPRTPGAPLADWPNCPQFYRVRYLETPASFAALTTAKPVRYVQRPETRPVAYYSPLYDWITCLTDPDQPVILTEGELKAAKATREGFPAIGLGGVYNWRALKHGIEWIDSLTFVTWARRHVYIVFDSDVTTNANVCTAVNQLAQQCEARGAYVHVVLLPTLEGVDKVGLDDFLVLRGASGPDELRELLRSAVPLRMTTALFALNARYAYVKSPGLIVETATRKKFDPGPFQQHVESKRDVVCRELSTTGEPVYKTVSAATTWIKWPLRHEVDEMTYRPGAEMMLEDGAGTWYNLWPGWGCQPVAGPVTLWHQLIDHLFSTAEPAAKAWFLRWCAYPLQYPGVKLFSSAVIHGRRHGTGKSLIGYTLGRIYGKNFTEITQSDLHGSFNEWAEGKQFVLGDDVTGSNKRQEGDVLKKLITQRELRVNAKYMPSYVVPDCINYYFTSNHPDAFFLEDDDRRFFIHEVDVDPLDEAFYAEYDLWMESGGAQAIFQFLRTLPLDGFNPAAPAYRTQAKERMIVDGQSDLGTWVRQLVENPNYVLRLGECPLPADLYTSKELLALYDPIGRTGTTANGLSRELRRAGVPQLYDGKIVSLPSGASGRYYIVRRAAVWKTALRAAVIEHLTAGSVPPAKKY